MIERVRQEMQDTQEEHDEHDQQKIFEAKSEGSYQKKKSGPKQDEGIKERFPMGKVSCAFDYDQ